MGGKQSKNNRRGSLSDLHQIHDVLTHKGWKNVFEEYLKKVKKDLQDYVTIWDECRSTPNNLEKLKKRLDDLDGFNTDELWALADNTTRSREITKACEDKLQTQFDSFKTYAYENKIRVN